MTRTSPLTTKRDAEIMDEYAELMETLNEEDDDYSWVRGTQDEDEEGDWQ